MVSMVKKKIAKKIDEINCESVKPLKVRFCPECRSTDVGFVFMFKNLFGLLPRVECYKCGHNNVDFPLLVVAKKDLKRARKNVGKIKKVRKKNGRR